ncbi:MAG: response regulator, partial [Melioribacteraceae bacterium]|nr:response regulator [Melioribacteraceae bacterium]
DLILVDLNDTNINPIKTVTDLGDDIRTKSIPILAFIDKIPNEMVCKNLNNEIIETTLLSNKHPLDVLKIIRDRIQKVDNSIFTNSSEKIEDVNTIVPPNLNHELESLDKIKILVVDDDEDTRFTIGEMIESMGFMPLFASNGYDCLVQLEKLMPDLVLLDIMMPKMDGFQTIRKIRQNPKFNNLNVFALTAYAMLSDKEIVEKNGFNGLITKPVNTDQLNRKFNQIFSVIKE